MSREIIQTRDFSDVRLGDTIAIHFPERNLTISGLSVKGRPGKLYVNIGKEFSGGPDRILHLKDLTSSHKLERVIREVKRTPYKREIKEIDFTRYDSKSGTRASLEDALETVRSVEDYFEYRVSIGDPLLDQWMVDAYNSSRAAVSELEKLMKALGHHK